MNDAHSHAHTHAHTHTRTHAHTHTRMARYIVLIMGLGNSNLSDPSNKKERSWFVAKTYLILHTSAHYMHNVIKAYNGQIACKS